LCTANTDKLTLMSALGQRAAQNDPDLALVNAAWAGLPDAVRAGILAMVKAAASGK
jgi:hypothetical protein